MGEIMCVPGQSFNDALEPPYSTTADFSLYTYNEEEHCYYAAVIEHRGRTHYDTRLYFENGVLQGYTYKDKWGWTKEIWLTYGDDITPVTLPSEMIVEND